MTSTSKRTLPIVVLAAATLTLAGCGGGSSSGSKGSDSAKPLSVAQANKLVAAINLTAADLPGFTAQANTQTASDKADNAALTSCAGLAPHSEDIVDVLSKDFHKGDGEGQQEIESEVSVLPSSQVVQSDLTAIKTTKAANCFDTYISKSLKDQSNADGSVGTVKFTAETPAIGDASDSFAYQGNVSLTASGHTIPIYFYIYGLADGPAEIQLTTFEIGQQMPAAQLKSLETTLNSHVSSSASLVSGS